MIRVAGDAFLLAQIMAENKMEFRDDLCIDSAILSARDEFKMLPKEQGGASATESFLGDVYLTVNSQNKQYDIPVAIKAFLHIQGFNENIQRYMIDDFESLEYESKVYKFIFNNIIKPGYSPNFVSYISYGCCTFNSLMGIPHISYDNLRSLTQRIVQSYRKDGADMPNFQENNRICMIITEQAGNGKRFNCPNAIRTKPLLHYFGDGTDENLSIISPSCQLKIMFQIIYSVACMNLFRINHNDLHNKNILVSEFENPIPMSFEVQGQIFAFETRYVPYLFDWDFAYSSLLGKNPKIHGYKHINIYYDFHPCKDLYTLFCYLNFTGIVPSQYRRKESEYTRNKHRIPIDSNIYERIQDKYEPYTKNIYNNKVYKVKRDELVYEIGIRPLFFQNIPNINIHFIVVKESGDYYLEFWEGHHCRWTTVDKESLPTPVELILNKNTWSQWIYPSRGIFDEFKSRTRNMFHYKLPTLETISTRSRSMIRKGFSSEPKEFTKPRFQDLKKEKGCRGPFCGTSKRLPRMKTDSRTGEEYYESD